MSKLQIHSVSISWSISRGRETYGWNICRATSRQTGKTYRTMGGGYDMVGTVVGDWFAAEYQAELQAMKEQAQAKGGHAHPNFYGLTIQHDGTVSLDGACGIDCMLNIIEACGFEYQRQYDPRKKSKATTGYLISKVIEE